MHNRPAFMGRRCETIAEAPPTVSRAQGVQLISMSRKTERRKSASRVDVLVRWTLASVLNRALKNTVSGRLFKKVQMQGGAVPAGRQEEARSEAY